jgi:hypothetical protein
MIERYPATRHARWPRAGPFAAGGSPAGGVTSAARFSHQRGIDFGAIVEAASPFRYLDARHGSGLEHGGDILAVGGPPEGDLLAPPWPGAGRRGGPRTVPRGPERADCKLGDKSPLRDRKADWTSIFDRSRVGHATSASFGCRSLNRRQNPRKRLIILAVRAEVAGR